MKWIVGSDHAGYELKCELIEALQEWGDQVEDVGTVGAESVDYPDYAKPVAEKVAKGDGLGLLVCGTGMGMMMAANKVKGIRCALVTNEFTAKMSKAHNNANVISMGSRVTGGGVAKESLKAFRDTKFEGGRHGRRVGKINEIDERK